MLIYPYQEGLVRTSVAQALDYLEHARDLLSSGLGVREVEKLLMELRAAQDRATDAVGRAVVLGRAAGLTWAEVGEDLGVSKQAAHQRYGSE